MLGAIMQLRVLEYAAAYTGLAFPGKFGERGVVTAESIAERDSR
jgi:hypothetical protein